MDSVFLTSHFESIASGIRLTIALATGLATYYYFKRRFLKNSHTASNDVN